jgi:hypothetical protein
MQKSWQNTYLRKSGSAGGGKSGQLPMRRDAEGVKTAGACSDSYRRRHARTSYPKGVSRDESGRLLPFENNRQKPFHIGKKLKWRSRMTRMKILAIILFVAFLPSMHILFAFALLLTFVLVRNRAAVRWILASIIFVLLTLSASNIYESYMIHRIGELPCM